MPIDDPQNFILGMSAFGAFVGGLLFVGKAFVFDKFPRKDKMSGNDKTWMTNQMANPIQGLSSQMDKADKIERADMHDVHAKIDHLGMEMTTVRKEVQAVRDDFKEDLNEVKSDIREIKDDIRKDIVEIRHSIEKLGDTVSNVNGQISVMRDSRQYPTSQYPPNKGYPNLT